jgi:hypothetical protein
VASAVPTAPAPIMKTEGMSTLTLSYERLW